MTQLWTPPTEKCWVWPPIRQIHAKSGKFLSLLPIYISWFSNAAQGASECSSEKQTATFCWLVSSFSRPLSLGVTFEIHCRHQRSRDPSVHSPDRFRDAGLGRRLMQTRWRSVFKSQFLEVRLQCSGERDKRTENSRVRDLRLTQESYCFWNVFINSGPTSLLASVFTYSCTTALATFIACLFS